MDVLVALLAYVAIGGIGLLPIVVRPLTRHRHPAVRRAAKGLVMLLFWAGFNLSLMAIWGAVKFTPEFWIGLVFLPLLQIPAAWLGYRVAFGD
ncbi:MAG TPA: hypothetical protein VG275_14415 [Solirubrobacteraceae bacterium]|jgi:hypothetical protein|nr:hypothetical protein [Solirubrobacteraceae bacterium]